MCSTCYDVVPLHQVLAECAFTFHSLLDSEFSLLSTVVREDVTFWPLAMVCVTGAGYYIYVLYRRWPLIS